jgi:hypothetical protein
VQQLAAEGVLCRACTEDGQQIEGKFPIPKSIHDYIRHKVATSVNTEDESELIELKKEDLRWRNRKSANVVGRLEGDLHHTDVVQRILDDMNVTIRQRALAIPQSIARLLVGQSEMPVIVKILTDAMHSLLHESKEYRREDFVERNADFIQTLDADEIQANEEEQRQFNENYAEDGGK